jgi:hypothetical protein
VLRRLRPARCGPLPATGRWLGIAERERGLDERRVGEGLRVVAQVRVVCAIWLIAPPAFSIATTDFAASATRSRRRRQANADCREDRV